MWRAVVLVIGAGLVSVFLGCAVRGEVEEEDREVARFIRENKMKRHMAHRQALRVEHSLQVRLRPAEHPTTNCTVEYGPDMTPVRGILPVACGDFDRVWPLQVAYGYLRCEKTPFLKEVIFTAPNGREYAVNNNARSAGYPKIAPLLRHGMASEKLSLTNEGLTLC